MDLDTLDRERCQDSCRFTDITVRFSRQSDDDVDANFYLSARSPAYGIKKDISGVATVDSFEGLIMNRLKTKFQPDMILFRISLQERNHLVRNTVGSGSDGQSDDISLAQGFIVELFQGVIWSISICKCLKISNIFFCPPVFLVKCFSLSDLFGYRW